MKLKKPELWAPPFYVFQNTVADWVVLDAEMNEPLVFGNSAVCKRFISKYLPPDATILYFYKDSPKSFHHLAFVWRGTYEGVPVAAEAESEDKKRAAA